MAHTFKVGQKVRFTNESIAHDCDGITDREEHTIISIEPVSSDHHQDVGHHQWLIIEGGILRDSGWSGWHFEPAN